ncbi:MAG: serine/threonine-protein kinase [Nitrososphaeria archaeon]
MLNPHDKIDKYEIIEEIGRGGMAIVYKALHPFLERYVAIKILPEYFVQDKEFVERFSREAKTMVNLNHPNIVKIYDAGVFKNYYFIVMELIEGQTVKELIKTKGKLDIDLSLEITIQVANALSYAHNKGIVHRDVKPSNILVEEKSNRSVITDFGIAKAIYGTKLTQTGVSLGTPEYMAPEQFGTELVVDQRTDIYSLGIVLYEMLTGEIPFKGDTPIGVAFKHVNTLPERPRIKNPKISPYLEKIILKMLAKDPEDRYESMDELLKDLYYLKSGDYEKISANLFEFEKKCKVSIYTNPTDAKVYIDGVYVGLSNVEELPLDYGPHKILITKRGYDDYSEEFNLSVSRKTYRIDCNLVREIPEEKVLVSEEETKQIKKDSDISESQLNKTETSINNVETKDETNIIDTKETLNYKSKSKFDFKKYVLVPFSIFFVILLLWFFGFRKTNSYKKISVYSSPEGASVYINGSLVGVTPLLNYKPTQESFRLELKKEGYMDHEQDINLDNLENGTINVSLMQQPVIQKEEKHEGFLTILSDPPGCSVFVNGTRIETVTPIENYNLDAGEYKVEVKKEGYKDFSQVIKVSDNSNYVLNCKLEVIQKPTETANKIGYLKISSNPTGAKIYINNSYKGITPLNLTLNEGTYVVKLLKEDYVSFSKEVVVESGKTSLLNATLTASRKATYLNLYSDPSGASVYIDGKLIGTSPITKYYISTGSHEILVEKEGFLKWLNMVNIKEGENDLNIQLTPKP